MSSESNSPIQNENFRKDLLNKLPAFIFRYDFDPSTSRASFSFANEGIETIFGLKASEVLDDATPFFGKIHPDDLPSVRKSMKKSAETMQEWTCEFRAMDNKEKYVWVEGIGKPLQDKNGIVSGYGLITKSKDKMLALKESEEKLQSLNELHSLINNFSSLLIQTGVESLHDAIDTTLLRLGEYADVDRVYIFEHDIVTDEVNNTFEWCAEGITPEIKNLQHIPFDAVPRWKEKFIQKEHVYIPLISEIADEYHVEREILEPQGIVSLLTIPMYYGDRFMGFIGFDSVRKKREWSKEHIDLLRLAGEIIAGSIFREQFEKEIIEAQRIAEEANKAKSEFLANMSHEIRTPMNAILGFSEILHNTITDEKSKKYLATILNSGRTLLSLINDILDLSKIEAGQMEISEEPMRIKLVLNEIAQIFQARSAEKNLTININIDDNFPEVIMVDDVRLRQILFNLVGNAIKFTHSGGVELNAKSTPSPISDKLVDVEIAVADTGIGIDPALHENIFKSFYQIESDNTRKYGGTGLGLSITQKLVQIMGGTIIVDSQPEAGSTFTILLRSIEISSYEPQKKTIFDWKAGDIIFDKATLLIVDDVDFNRELVKSFLSESGFTIIEAVNGKMAIDMVKIHQPDVVLMDLRMPEMNGYEATEILSNLPETKHVPIVAFTASSMKHDEDLIRRLFKDYLRKPIGRDELINCLMQFIPHKKQNKENTEIQNDKPTELEINNYGKSQLEAFITVFDQELKASLDALKDFMDNELLAEFLEGLAKLSNQSNIKLFEHITIELRKDAANFDFDNFTKNILTLDHLINQIKEALNKD
jgi:PAS domain S-box-containing protein